MMKPTAVSAIMAQNATLTPAGLLPQATMMATNTAEPIPYCLRRLSSSRSSMMRENRGR